MNYEDLKLNYLELSFIYGVQKKDKLSALESKNIFRNALNLNPEYVIKRTDLASVRELKKFFEPIRSIDPRYDGINSLVFCLMKKSCMYKNYLSDKSVLKSKKLSGGKAVLWKIMTSEQKENFNKIINSKQVKCN